MAIISKIEEQKNKKRVNIFVDDAFFCGLEKETAVIFGLKTGKEVDEKTLNEMIFQSETKSAFEKATDYLAIRMHTRKELFDKLLKKGFDMAVVNSALDKLEEYHYVDDELFAKQFIEQNSKYSKRILENKLKQKGISQNIINSYTDVVDDDIEFELCLKQARKLAKTKKLDTKEDAQKFIQSLLRKGFSFDMAKKSLNAVKVGNEFDYDEIE